MSAKLVLGLILAAFISTADARSPSVAREFQRLHACPANGKTRGACPGWQKDHVLPLKCGGPDTTANLQWLTIEEHKRKTAREAHLCRHRK